jgi:hypothetical protein
MHREHAALFQSGGIMFFNRVNLFGGIAILLFLAPFQIPYSQAGETQKAFCALQISVTNGDGTPVRTAVVDLLDSLGKVVQTQEAKDGHVEFCDFAFDYHSVRVRGATDNNCESMVRNIKLVYGKSQKITVVSNICSYGNAAAAKDSYSYYLRVSSSSGEKLSGVRIEQKGHPPQFTDEFGRAQVTAPLSSVLELKLLKEGFEPKELFLEIGFIPDETDLAVEMKKLK